MERSECIKSNSRNSSTGAIYFVERAPNGGNAIVSAIGRNICLVTRHHAITKELVSRYIHEDAEKVANWLWFRNRPVQKEFPDMSADEREFLMTGITKGDGIFDDKVVEEYNNE